MAPPLIDGQVTYADGTPNTRDQMAKDVAAFLTWTAEPTLVKRTQTGWAVLGFLIFATVLALFTSPLSALIFGILYLIYIQIEAYVITPRVMSKAISIPGSLVVIGALIGGTLLGLIGALVAVPVTASILLIIKQVYIPKQDAKI